MKVTLYVKNGDPHSDMVRNLLRYHDITFEMIDVSRNIEKQKELQEISGQTNTPVLKLDDKIFIGFDLEKIKEVLGINKNE